MIITRKCLDEILTINIDSNVEFGGIIGRDENGVITEVFVDKGKRFKDMPLCCYYPDVDRLNGIIEKWSEDGIEFCGIYHTHYAEIGSFSVFDMDYMRNILNAMPEDRKKLYFPLLLLPKAKLRSYVVSFSSNGEISVTADKIDIKEGGVI